MAKNLSMVGMSKRFSDLAEAKGPLPSRITLLEDRIKVATRATLEEIKQNGRVSHMALDSISKMRLDLENLYIKWSNGELDGENVIIPARR